MGDGMLEKPPVLQDLGAPEALCAVGLPMLQGLGPRGAQASGACGVMDMNQEQNLLFLQGLSCTLY